jgi:hypothetical protein
MSILGLFKLNKKKSNSTAIKVSLDIQLERLARLGIQPKDTDFVEWIYQRMYIHLTQSA